MRREPQVAASMRWVVALVAAVAAGCSGAGDGSVVVGRLKGDVSFRDPTPEVRARLALAGPAASPSGAVRLVTPGSTAVVASTTYAAEPDLTLAAPRLARFDMQPPARDANPSYLVEVKSVAFADGSAYRFGSRSAASPFRHECPLLPGVADAPDGIVCSFSECAAMARVTVRLQGAAEDLDALTDMSCGIVALVDEVPPNASWTPQALAPRLINLGNARSSAGDVVEMLVRADAPLSFQAGCLSSLAEGQTGFVLDPGTGKATFASVEDGRATIGCGTAGNVDVTIRVERNSGSITGLFDLAGETEADAWIRAWNPFRQLTPPTFAAGISPSRTNPADAWRIGDLAPGAYTVEARALTQDRMIALELPWKGNRNGFANVAPRQTRDLGATFVVDPVRAHGTMTLLDPTGEARLDELSFGTFASVDIGDGLARAWAEGNVLPPEGGVSGEGAWSWGVLRRPAGTPAGAHVAGLPLGYELLFAGLSPVAGDTDGSDALPANWTVRGAQLDFNDGAGNRQFLQYAAERQLEFSSADAEPIEIPPMSTCMGRVELELHAAPGVGSLFDPRVTTDWLFATPENTGDPAHSARLNVSGTPREAAQAANVATLHAAAPDGIRYVLKPKVRIVGPGGTSTDVALDPVTVPNAGGLACGGVARACIVVEDAEGAIQALTVGLQRQRDCDAGTDVFVVTVDSGGSDIDRLEYTIDASQGGTAQVACASCASGETTVNLATLPPGPHDIVVRAETANGCTATTSQPFDTGPCPPIVTPREQIAVATESGVSVFRLSDGGLQFTVAATAMTDVGYDDAGDRLACLGAGTVRIVSASDGSLVSNFNGSYVDVEFAPGSATLLAFVERLPGAGASGPYRLVILDEAASRYLVGDPISSPVGVTMSSPRVAWSPDGTKIVVFYDTVHVASGESRLFMPTWNVADNLQAAGSDLLGPADRPGDFTRPAREIGVDVGWISDATLDLAATRGLYTVGSALTLHTQRDVSVIAADLHLARLGILALIGGTTSTHVAVLTDAGYLEGPEATPKTRDVAVERNPWRVAVLGADEVVVHRLGEPASLAFTLERTIAVRGAAIAIRPTD